MYIPNTKKYNEYYLTYECAVSFINTSTLSLKGQCMMYNVEKDADSRKMQYKCIEEDKRGKAVLCCLEMNYSAMFFSEKHGNSYRTRHKKFLAFFPLVILVVSKRTWTLLITHKCSTRQLSTGSYCTQSC